MALCVFYLVSSFFFDRDDIIEMMHKNLDSHRGMYLALDELPTENSWSRVCVFAPYTTSEEARGVLGLDWDIEDHSSIKSNEGITALVFAGSAGVSYVAEYPRKSADFSKLSGKCFEKSRARFKSDGTNVFLAAE